MNRSPGESVRRVNGPKPRSAQDEDCSSAAEGDLGLKNELLRMVEAELHGPVMAAEPHQLSEEHRRRLLNVQEAVRAEMDRMRACRSAADVVSTLLGRAEAGELDALDEDARFLGFRPLAELARELAERATLVRAKPREPTGEHG